MAVCWWPITTSRVDDYRFGDWSKLKPKTKNTRENANKYSSFKSIEIYVRMKISGMKCRFLLVVRPSS